MDLAARLRRAADLIRGCDALLIAAGAGMGVDSGLPDFRGPEGFWNAYPPYRRLGLRFVELANPRWFHNDPSLAWGFYGHRLELYRVAQPHAGYALLRRWAESKPAGWFVFTSNVDGHFDKAGFDPHRIVEVHGSIHFLQCLRKCGIGIFPADGITVTVDPQTMRAVHPLPACPRCGSLARPNVLMFGDWDWDDAREADQESRLASWLGQVQDRPLAIVEIGAGLAVPTVRRFCEAVRDQTRGTLIRVNPREPEGADIGLPMTALEALCRIHDILGGDATAGLGEPSSRGPEEVGQRDSSQAPEEPGER